MGATKGTFGGEGDLIVNEKGRKKQREGVREEEKEKGMVSWDEEALVSMLCIMSDASGGLLAFFDFWSRIKTKEVWLGPGQCGFPFNKLMEREVSGHAVHALHNV